MPNEDDTFNKLRQTPINIVYVLISEFHNSEYYTGYDSSVQFLKNHGWKSKEYCNARDAWIPNNK